MPTEVFVGCFIDEQPKIGFDTLAALVTWLKRRSRLNVPPRNRILVHTTGRFLSRRKQVATPPENTQPDASWPLKY